MNLYEKIYDCKINKAATKYLKSLAQCSKTVVIASPRYEGSFYSCEIMVTADSLKQWAIHHVNSGSSGDFEREVARHALPIWLDNANTEDESLTYVPTPVFNILRAYILDIINRDTPTIFCFDCQAIVTHIQMNKLNEKTMGGWGWWTDIWTCPKGHELYYQEHEIHVHWARE